MGLPARRLAVMADSRRILCGAAIPRTFERAVCGGGASVAVLKHRSVHRASKIVARLIPQLYEDRRFLGMKPYIRQGIPYDSPLLTRAETQRRGEYFNFT